MAHCGNCLRRLSETQSSLNCPCRPRYDRLAGRIRELEAREKQLRELHRPDGDYGYMSECVSCGTQWPCTTSAILGSETH